ncbi:PLP-dependent aminotransferase family protein [Clostridium magnum]|uniref:HTH-type transcriptional regulator NorG n=1 Tax=Clostridium magnum DSM 2767 TaxID=1121326 RepID=A0A161WWE5_9CLOT|nr:PLP-dependent aminotransferase family protein [Clostridium magnum]KZL91288.1 HTH-type transcriptional regulator NorG [Clostridium magnum DSM 2767]SHI36197.1 DNA-binding transcriptional regulator, MocR family, contains an aminotransferase domain [Clostridium magnum DSM 2767]
MLKYQLIIQYIKNEISNGNLAANKKLPSLRIISELFNCSVGTVLKAYNELEKEHIIYSLSTSGYYVLESDFSNTTFCEDTLIDFSSAAPDVNTLPYKKFQHCLNNAIELYKENLFTYCDPRGLDSLIQVLARHLNEYQIFTNPDNIVVTTGSQQALSILSTMPFPNGNSKVLVEQPTYYGIIKSLELNSVSTLGIERNFNGINLHELEKLFKYGNIKFFYTIPRFHNPTGNSYTRQEKEAIVKLAEKYNVYIVEDDIMADLELDKKSDPMFSYDTASRVIYLKSYSKILVPGLRIAAVILPKLLINTFLEYKKWIDMSSPILSQGALEIYLKSGMLEKHRKKISKLYSDRMICLKNTVSSLKHPKIRWNIPKSGYFACIYVDNKLRYDKIMSALSNKNIKLLDTSTCFLREYRTNNYFRISISKTNEEKIKKGIPIVLDTIQKYLTDKKQGFDF